MSTRKKTQTPPRHRGYLVTGTDTEIGKTVATCAMIAGLANAGYQVAAIKPVAAGLIRDGDDGEWVSEDVVAHESVVNVRLPRPLSNPVRLLLPMSPHIAAMRENQRIPVRRLARAVQDAAVYADVTFAEGAGGFMTPLTDAETFADFARALSWPVILVVGLRLGCLNHALLTVKAIARRRLTLAGWVGNTLDSNMPALQENVDTLRSMIDAPCLGVLPHSATLDYARLAQSLQLKPIMPGKR